MKKLFTTLLMMTLAIGVFAQKPSKNENASLYDRLGGEQGISKIVDDLVDLHMVNPGLSKRFLPYKGTKGLEIVKQHNKDFFSMGTGGPAKYKGRDMVTAHTGLNITYKEFVLTVDDLLLALDKNNIDEETKKDVMAIFWSLKDSVIEK